MHVKPHNRISVASCYLTFVACLWIYPQHFPGACVHASEHVIKVALFADRGAVAIQFKKEFARSDDASITYSNVDGNAIRSGALQQFDVLLVPGGSALKEANSMGTEAREEVRRFVKNGGIYMGVCAGAYLASQAKVTDIGLLPLKTLDPAHWYRVDDATRVDVELTPLGMEAFGIKKRNIAIKYENGPIFAGPASGPNDRLMPLGFYRSEVVGDGGDRGAMLGAPAVVLAKYGQGTVMAISPHFEATPGFKQVQLHALHWLYDHRGDATVTGGSSLSASTDKSTSTTTSASTSASGRAVTIANTSRDKTAVSSDAQGDDQTDYSKLGRQALKVAETAFDNASVVGYVHRNALASRQVVSQPDGSVEARTDCSGFMSYVVHSVAPKHYLAIRSLEPEKSYPQAKIWAQFFDSLDKNQPHDGWLAISNWKDLRPGDLIAWQEGKISPGGNTGHVMMVRGTPGEIQQQKEFRYFEVPVIDSSSVYHFPPEHLPPKASQAHRNGLGTGNVRILLSDDNAPIGYWAGTYWGEGQKQINHPTFTKLVRFARMTPLQKTND
jgi:putative intracellular protease/amidase